MNEKEIKRLLETFYKGETTTEEEIRLKAFFDSDEALPEQWEADKQCFRALYEADDIVIPEGLSGRLEKRIHEHASGKKEYSINRTLYRISTAAAVILLCVGLYLYEIKPVSQPQLADTYTDPIEAAIAAEEVLSFMSRQLNLGLEQVSEATGEMQKVNEIVYQQLKD